MTRYILVLILGLSAFKGEVKSQNIGSTREAYQWNISLFTAGGQQKELPFYIPTNTFATISKYGFQSALKLGIAQLPRSWRDIQYQYGFDIIGRLSGHNTVYVHQAYIRAKYNVFTLTAGRIEQNTGEFDRPGSLGSTLWSHNTTPIPKILIQSDYFQVPGLRGYINVKGHLGHGWFEPSREVKNVYLHEKSFYIQVDGQDMVPFKAWGGIVQVVQWGGIHPNPDIFGRMLPQSFSDYLRVFFGLGADKNGDATAGEKTNVIGNTLAVYDFGILIPLKNIDFWAYKQFFHEDKVSLQFRNPWDGVWGTGFERHAKTGLITSISGEHFRFIRQGSRTADGELRGTDNYYNHFVYYNGWTYNKRVLGYPLVLNHPDYLGVSNNIIWANHLVVSGRPTPLVNYTMFATWSQNEGTDNLRPVTDPFNRIPGRYDKPLHRLSLALDIETPLIPQYNIKATWKIAYDRGDLAPSGNNLGFMLTIHSSGNF